MLPAGAVDVRGFGAVGDGVTLDTQAIQAALDAAGAAGGGVVFVGPGTYRIGTIFLRSHVDLHLSGGARLVGSSELSDYVRLKEGIVGDRTGYHLVVADGVENAGICGSGTIDGNGSAFWEPTLGEGLERWPTREPDAVRGRLMWIFAVRKEDGRPSPMVELRRSRRVRVEGVHLTDSAGWTLHVWECDHVRVDGIVLTSNLMGPNNDGIDITGSSDVLVSNSDISCCDDAVCLKTYPGERPCQRVCVTNCTIRTRCAAFKTGEAHGHFRQITFSNSVVYECSRAVALYADNGCLVEDVLISNIVCDTRSPLMMNRPIHLDARTLEFGGQWTRAGVCEQRPLGMSMEEFFKLGPVGIRNVQIENMICRTDGRILLTAEPGVMLSNISLRDVHLIYPTVDDPDPIGATVGGVQFSNRNPQARVARAAVVAENIRNLRIRGLQISWPATDGDGVVQTPAEWRFALKAANGSLNLWEREQFNTDRLPAFSVLWGRNLQGGSVEADLACPSRSDAAMWDVASSTIRLGSGG